MTKKLVNIFAKLKMFDDSTPFCFELTLFFHIYSGPGDFLCISNLFTLAYLYSLLYSITRT